ncbi:MAG TPA: zinc-ribbon domain-containing protein [Micavibrio sp.]
MIITCEKCSARYLLTSLLLGDEGRSVRCGVCGHTWFQDPVDEPDDGDEAPQDGSADIHGDDELHDEGRDKPSSFQAILDHEALEPIPQGVRPIPESASLPALHAGEPAVRAGTLNGIIAAAAVFILISGALVAMRGTVVHVWQPSALLFDRIGLPVPAPGEGLVFDKITATIKADGKDEPSLIVRGDIINLRESESSLPVIEASLRKAGGEQGKSLMASMNKKTINAEETIPFAITFDKIPEDITDVNVLFKLD